MSSHRDELITGLRALADWLDANPQVPIDEYTRVKAESHAFTFASDPGAEADLLAAVVRTGGRWKKEHYGPYTSVVRDFGGGVEFSLSAHREAVCRRVVEVEEVEVTEPDPEAVAALPVVTRTVQRERVSWVCDDPILARRGPSLAEAQAAADAVDARRPKPEAVA